MRIDGWINEVIACPRCIANLIIFPHDMNRDQIINGTFVCENCGSTYPIIDGMMFFGLLRSASTLRKQEMQAEFEWNFILNDFIDHSTFAQTSFSVAQDAIDKLNTYVPHGRVLDAGAGGGCHSWQLANRGYDVLSADLTPELLACGDSLFDANIYFERAVTDCLCLPLKAASFDVVFCKELAHHVQDLPGLFHEFYRVLKPEGALVLIEPLRPRRQFQKPIQDPCLAIGLTHQDYALDDYMKAMTSCNFQSIEMRHYRRPISRKYLPLHYLDVLLVNILGLNLWDGLSLLKQLRAQWLGGTVSLIAKRGKLDKQYADHKLIEIIPSESLEKNSNELEAMRSIHAKLIPLLSQIAKNRDEPSRFSSDK